MSSDSLYLLDANVFIEAKRHYYAFDIMPGFWANLIHHAENDRIRSIDYVKDELMKGKDELSDWAKENFHEWFISTNQPDIVNRFGEIMNWVQSKSQFKDGAKADFARGADGWLAACAKAKNHVLVTHEEYKPEVKNRVPIPNVCRAFSVEYINTFEMLRRLRISLG